MFSAGLPFTGNRFMNCHINSAVLCVLFIKVITLYDTLAHSDETHIYTQNHFSNEFVKNGNVSYITKVSSIIVTAFKEKPPIKLSLKAHNEISLDVHLHTGSSHLREQRRANIKTQRMAMEK